MSDLCSIYFTLRAKLCMYNGSPDSRYSEVWLVFLHLHHKVVNVQ